MPHFSRYDGIRIAAATAAILMASCTSTRDYRPPVEAPVYFPPTAFPERSPGAWAFINSWYSKHLLAMNEPSLYDNRSDTGSIYRFTYLPSFSEPIVVRVDHGIHGATVTTKKLSGQGGYDPGHLVLNETTAISSEDWQAVQDRVAALREAKLVSAVERGCLDGAEWIFETRDESSYSIVARTSPPDCGSCEDLPLIEASLQMLRVAGATGLAELLGEAATSCKQANP